MTNCRCRSATNSPAIGNSAARRRPSPGAGQPSLGAAKSTATASAHSTPPWATAPASHGSADTPNQNNCRASGRRSSPRVTSTKNKPRPAWTATYAPAKAPLQPRCASSPRESRNRRRRTPGRRTGYLMVAVPRVAGTTKTTGPPTLTADRSGSATSRPAGVSQPAARVSRAMKEPPRGRTKCPCARPSAGVCAHADRGAAR